MAGRSARGSWILVSTDGPVDYESVFHRKMPLIAEAARNFSKHATGNARARFEQFCRENQSWLDDFVLFDELRSRYKLANWNEWPVELARREPVAIEKISRELAEDLAMRRAIQFAFYEQWRALRRYCVERSIRMVGDLAIFVNYDSADVWTHPELFRLDANLNSEVVSGVPPDFFSATGQRWGNPLYRWDVMKQQGYAWWIERLRWATQNCDYIRLDHFRGFAQFWEIAASEPTAMNGRWVDGPNDDLFVKVRAALGGLPFFAEDLGYITPDVHALRERLQIPGMAVLQFGFGDAGAHIYLPQQFTPDIVVYTGTHDNDTLLGWWTSGASEQERRSAEIYLGRRRGRDPLVIHPRGSEFGGELERGALAGCTWIGQRCAHEYSEPGWWKLAMAVATGFLKPDVAEKLARLAELTDRLPKPSRLGPDETVA